MDVLTLCTKETAECRITHPATGEATDIVITVYGMDSRKFREIVKAGLKARVDAKANGGGEVDSDQVNLERLADLTVGWEGVEFGGKPMKFSRENAIKVYSLSAPIRGQVDAFIGRVSNFLPKA